MEKNREFSKNFPENPGKFPENPGKFPGFSGKFHHQ
jgi:hypothetical protein